MHHANIHLYNALAPLFRRVVFRASKDEIKDIAVRGTELVMKHSENVLGQTVIGYEYRAIRSTRPYINAVTYCSPSGAWKIERHHPY